MTGESTRYHIKRLIIDSLGLEGLTPDDIGDDAPLFGDGEGSLGLDSVDALELMVVFERDFGISIDTDEVDAEAFSTVASLERFVDELRATAPVATSSLEGSGTPG